MAGVKITGDFGPFIEWLLNEGGSALLQQRIDGETEKAPVTRLYKVSGVTVTKLKQWAKSRDECEILSAEPALVPYVKPKKK